MYNFQRGTLVSLNLFKFKLIIMDINKTFTYTKGTIKMAPTGTNSLRFDNYILCKELFM